MARKIKTAGKPKAKSGTSSKGMGGILKTLADVLDERDLTEIEYSEGNKTIRLARQSGGMVMQAAPAPAAPAASPPTPAAPAQEAAAANDTSAGGDDHPGAVPSPMVGTVYLSPEPGAKPFITEGDSVTKGQTLVIVEAMKVMNPIAAPKAGKVTKILIADAQPVEYGQALVIVE